MSRYDQVICIQCDIDSIRRKWTNISAIISARHAMSAFTPLQQAIYEKDLINQNGIFCALIISIRMDTYT